MESDDRAQWSEFWRQGFITTFGASKPHNYDGVVRSFWLTKLEALPSGARILDIATGNGAIATMAAEFSRTFNKNFAVAATDLAEINKELAVDPVVDTARDRIDFYSHVPCEKQPFEDDSFELVSSQFGFEYSDTEKTLGEVRRVLVPGGMFAAISHHADSSLIQSSRLELDVYRTALDELALFELFRRFLAAAGNLSGSQQQFTRAMKQAQPYSQKINEAVDSFQRRHPDQQCANEIINAISHFARSARTTEKSRLLAEVRTAEMDFQFARARLIDMVEASLDEEQISLLQQHAATEGFRTVNTGLLHGDDGALAGWQIQMQ